MFSGLTEGFRSIRSALLNGYTLLFAAWLIWPSLGLDGIESDSVLSRSIELFDSLGSTARLGALSFGAVVLGGALERLIVGPLLDRIEYLFDAPLWDEWALTKLAAAQRYAAKSVRIERRSDRAPVVTDTGSFFYERKLHDDYQTARRDGDEARFRLNLQVAVTPAGILAAILGSFWWLLPTGVSVLVLALELSVRNARVSEEMTTTRLGSLKDEIEDAGTEVQKWEGSVGRQSGESARSTHLFQLAKAKSGMSPLAWWGFGRGSAVRRATGVRLVV